jgi:ATP-binding cassette subfamily C protein
MSGGQPSGLAEHGFAALLRDYRKFAGPRLWSAFAIMLLGAIVEGFGLLMIVPLASIAIGTDQASFARFAGWAGAFSPNARFAVALALFVAAMAARSALLYVRDLQTAQLQAGYAASLRLRAAATLARRGWTFASRIGQAGMQSLLLNDVPRAALAVAYVQQFAIYAVMLAVQLSLTAILSPVLTALAIAILLAAALLSVGWMRRGVMSGMAISQTSAESASSGFRLHAGLKAALAQGTVRPFLDEYETTLAAATGQILTFTRDYSAARQLAALGAAIAAALLLFVGVRLLDLPFPVLIASLVLFARMSGPAQGLQQTAQQVAAYAPSFAAIEKQLGKLDLPSPPESSRKRLDWSELRLDDIRFEHQPGLGLGHASLAVKPGEWIAVTGASGAGKTTLVDLVSGLLSPEQGALTVDGQALDDKMLQRWRAGLAYVGQEGSVFNDSVRGNLLAEGAAADHAALWEVLELVDLADRVRAFPNGLGESVGDRGSALSGGERQRLVIARALLRRPSLLILDEATAALDADSEAALFQRLRALDPRPAAIVVAHRPSTLAHCDSVVSIQHGRLEKSGD